MNEKEIEKLAIDETAKTMVFLSNYGFNQDDIRKEIYELNRISITLRNIMKNPWKYAIWDLKQKIKSFKYKILRKLFPHRILER